MRNFQQLVIATFILALIGISAKQLYIYREYAYEMSWLTIRDKLGFATFQDLKRMATISNTFGEFRTSTNIFQRLYQLKPEDTDVLSNLALSLTFTNRAKEAQPYYRAYFSSGGKALDVMYWYGQALKSTDECDSATDWFYSAIYYNPYDTLAIKELVGCLLTQSRYLEALSFMGILINEIKNDAVNELWLSHLNRLELSDSVGIPNQPTTEQQQTRSIASEASEQKTENMSELIAKFNEGLNLQQNENNSHDNNKIWREINHARLPSINGKNYYLPYKTKHGQLRFIKIDRENRKNQIHISEWTDMVDNRIVSNRQKDILQDLNVGPWKLRDVMVELCSDCHSNVSIESLKKNGFIELKKGKINFLTFQL